MTAIYYGDCRATSPNGAFTLEARSPHNGTIPHRNGRPASPDEFAAKYREHQSHFRYQLLTGGSLVWERWQPGNEDSPREVVVSDDGWGILRTHGFCPDVIAVSPDGREVVRARIWYADNPDLKRGPPPLADGPDHMGGRRQAPLRPDDQPEAVGPGLLGGCRPRSRHSAPVAAGPRSDYLRLAARSITSCQ